MLLGSRRIVVCSQASQVQNHTCRACCTCCCCRRLLPALCPSRSRCSSSRTPSSVPVDTQRLAWPHIDTQLVTAPLRSRQPAYHLLDVLLLGLAEVGHVQDCCPAAAALHEVPQAITLRTALVVGAQRQRPLRGLHTWQQLSTRCGAAGFF